MKRVIFVLGDKGGTGKSVVARYLWDRLRSRGDAKAFDAAGHVGQLAQFYAVRNAAGSLVEPQPASGVEPILLHAEERGERDQGVYRIVECTAEVVRVVEGNLRQVVGVRTVSRVMRPCLRQVA